MYVLMMDLLTISRSLSLAKPQHHTPRQTKKSLFLHNILIYPNIIYLKMMTHTSFINAFFLFFIVVIIDYIRVFVC